MNPYNMSPARWENAVEIIHSYSKRSYGYSSTSFYLGQALQVALVLCECNCPADKHSNSCEVSKNRWVLAGFAEILNDAECSGIWDADGAA